MRGDRCAESSAREGSDRADERCLRGTGFPHGRNCFFSSKTRVQVSLFTCIKAISRELKVVGIYCMQ